MGKQREKEKEGHQRKSRGPRWALWETLLTCHVVIAIRNKYAQGSSGPELMREYNRLYAEMADEWEKLDHNRLPDRRVTVEESGQEGFGRRQDSLRPPGGGVHRGASRPVQAVGGQGRFQTD
jgi:hypothetical protein